MSETLSIRSARLEAKIASCGAELQSITDGAGRQYMTDADPRWWTGHAPILFPIVGALRGGRYRLDGREYEMGKHGFARRSEFAVVEQGPAAARFRLSDSPETLAQYPFRFTLDLAFALSGWTLELTARVANHDTRAMPFSFGFHPAFAWPLPGGGEKLAHDIVFQHDEPHDIQRLDAEGLVARDEMSPVRGDRFALRPELFENDAMIWDNLASRRLRYRGINGVALELTFPDCPMLGIWQKPGARYICLEPWHGLADPVDFDGELSEKPGSMELAPGDARSFTMTVTVQPPEEPRT